MYMRQTVVPVFLAYIAKLEEAIGFLTMLGHDPVCYRVSYAITHRGRVGRATPSWVASANP